MRRRLRPLLVPVLVAGVLAATPPVYADDAVLRFDFESLSDEAYRGVVADVSGSGNDGTVRSAGEGDVRAVVGADGSTAAAFPDVCRDDGGACALSIIRVPDAPALRPGAAPFSFGARVLLPPDRTSSGANIMQKGFYDDARGQWKLQVDGHAGLPSCVVSGALDGELSRSVSTSGTSIADGRWHRVSCSRTSAGLAVIVDGAVTGWQPSRPIDVASQASVKIAGKSIGGGDDQFHGTLDDVFVTIG